MEDKYLRKLLIWVIKIIPAILSFICVLYSILSMFDVNLYLISMLAGSSFISAIILLLCSFVFKFCFHHRIFIYYILLVNILNVVDYYILFSISSKWLILTTLLLFVVCAFVALYLHMKKHEIRIIKTRT